MCCIGRRQVFPNPSLKCWGVGVHQIEGGTLLRPTAPVVQRPNEVPMNPSAFRVEVRCGVLDGSLQKPWTFDLGGLKGESDLVFSYGISEGTFQGDVVYVVPEPGTVALLAGGLLGLMLWEIRRRRVA